LGQVAGRARNTGQTQTLTSGKPANLREMEEPMNRNRFSLTLGLFAAAAFAPAQLINEIRVDQTGTDNDEYFEIAGTAGLSLNDLTYIVIGDGTGGSGVIESVTSLAGLFIPADGHFLAAESSFTIGPPPDLNAGASGLNFENADNVTHMLLSGFTGSNGQDLDTNDDGVLDATPWSSLLDSVALVLNPALGDKVYSPTLVGPDGPFHPGHIYRTPSLGPNWAIGPFDPAQGLDTPGTANPVPEPATLAALALGAAALIRRRKRA
jgi:hypothetical protein